MDRILAQLEDVSRQNTALLEELRLLRTENADLRRQLATVRGSAHPLATPAAPSPSQTIPPAVRGNLSPIVDVAMAGTEDAVISPRSDPKKPRVSEPPSTHG